MVVGQEPGILARAVEELQVLVSRGEVPRRDVRALERLAEGVCVGVVAGGRRVLGLVAREVERLEGRGGGDARELGLEGGCESRGERRGDGGR